MKDFASVRRRPFLAPVATVFALVLALNLRPAVLSAQDADGLAAASSLERVLVDVIHRVEPSVVSVARVRQSPNVSQFNPFDPDQKVRADFDKPESPDFVPNEFGTGIVVAPIPGSASVSF